MSAELVDERVVEMRFDNKDFEKNVDQSIKTINKLKDSLDFEESEKSFENISKAAAKCDMKPLEDSLESVSVKFNMLEMVAAGVLTRIANEAVNAGVKFAKSMSIDQVSAGWSKYAQKTQSVQTIMSATGASIDAINSKLEKLIWFADETSYDFVDMVNNIGKFTSAGVDLDVAVNSMMGISNWAALSGAGIQQASRAMYNLSQAIGMGYVGIQDWKSIELANMATIEFKETVIETALAMGTLKQDANGVIKTMKGTEVTAENMRSSLKEQWFTSDVLNTALDQYSEFANAVKEFQDDYEAQTGRFLNVNQAIDEMIAQELVDVESLGYRAFRRAQEAITFNQAIAATADAASSGWMKTFEIIFGNYEQATKLWTDLANDMWEVFAGPAESRNEFLSDLLDSNYQKMLKSLPDGEEFNASLEAALKKIATNNLGETAANALFAKYDSLEELLQNESYHGSTIRSAFKDVISEYNKNAKDAAKLSKTLESGQLTLEQAAKRLAGGVYGKDVDTQRKIVEAMGFNYEYLADLSEAWKAGEDLPWDNLQKDLMKTLDNEVVYYTNFVQKIRELNPFDDFFLSFQEMSGRDKLIGGFQNIIDNFKNLYLTVMAIKDGFSSFTGSGSLLGNIIDGFYNITSILPLTDDNFEILSETIQDFFSTSITQKWKEFWHGKYYEEFSGTLEETVTYVPGMLSKIKDAYDMYIGRLPENIADTVNNVKNKLVGYLGDIPKKISEFREKYLGHFEEQLFLSKDGTMKSRMVYVNKSLDQLKTKINELTGGIAGKAFHGLISVFKRVADFLFGYEKDGEKVKGAIVFIYDKATALWQRLKDIGKTFNDTFAGLRTKYPFIDSISNGLKSIYDSTPFKAIRKLFGGEEEDIAGSVVDPNRMKGSFKRGFSFTEAFNYGKENASNFLTKVKDKFEEIYKNAGYTSVKEFFFGNKELGKDNIILRTINNVKDRFNELKAAHPWIQTVVDWIEKEIEKIKEILKSANGSLVDGLKKVKDYLFGVKDSISDIFGSVFKKEKKSVLEQMMDAITGPGKTMNKIFNTLRIFILSLSGLNIALMGLNFRGFGFEVKSPLAELVDIAKEFAIAVALIAGSFALVAVAIKKYDLSVGDVFAAVAILAGIMAALMACAIVLDQGTQTASLKDIIAQSVTTVPMLRTLAMVLAEIAAFAVVFTLLARFAGTKKVLAGAGAVAILLAGIGVLVAALYLPDLINRNGKNKLKSKAGDLIGIALILMMLVPFLLTLGAVIAEMALIATLIPKNPETLVSFGVLVAAVIGSITGILWALSKFSGKGINVSTVASLAIISIIIGQIGLIIGSFAVLSKVLGKGNMWGSWLILELTLGSVFAFIWGLTKALPKEGINSSILVALGAVVALIHVIGNTIETISKTIKSEGAGTVIGAFVGLIVSFGLLFAAIQYLANIKLNGQQILNVVTMMGMIGLLALEVWGLMEIAKRANITSWMSLLPMIASIGELAVAMVGLSFIIQILGGMGDALIESLWPAIEAIAAVSVGVLAIGAAFIGINEAFEWLNEKAGNENTSEAVNNVMEFLISIMHGIGEMVGALIGGLGEGISDSLPAISANITTFTENLKPFFEFVSGLTEAHAAGAVIFTGVLLSLVADTLIQGIGALIDLITPDATAMATNMSNFITNLQPYLNNVQNVTSKHATGARLLTTVLKETVKRDVLNAIDNIVKYFTGETNYTSYIKNLNILASGIVLMDQKLSSVNKSDIDNDISIMRAILDLVTDNEYKEGGIAGLFDSIINGTTNFTELFKKLNDEIAGGFATFADKVSGINVDNAEKAAQILPAIMDMLTNKNYRSGGISGFFKDLVIGDANYVEMFSALNTKILPGLRDFTIGISALDEEGNKIDYSGVETAATATKALMDLMSMNVSNLITDKDKTFFGWKYSDSDAKKLGESFKVINTVVVEAIKNLQEALTSSGIKEDYVDSTVGVFQRLVSALMDFSKLGLDEEMVKNIGTYIIEGLIVSLTNEEGTSRVYQAAYALGLTLVEGLKAGTEVQSPSKASKRVGQFIADGLMIGLMSGEKLTYDLARAFGENTIKALEDGVNHYADRGVTQHAINMVTEDLLDENIFDMPDFTTKHRFGHEIVDFDAMEKWMHENFDEHIGVDAIHNFVGAYRQEQEELAKTITDPEYAALMQKISAGDYGLGGQSIVSALERELRSREAVNQAWEDWNDLAKGIIKIDDKLIKQQKNMPIMTEEQWDEMWAHDEEGRQKRMSGYFDELARLNGTDWRTEAEKEGYDADFIQRMVNKEWTGSGMDMESYFRHLAEAELEAEHADKKKSESAQSVVGKTKETTEAINTETEALKNNATAVEETTGVYDHLSKPMKEYVDKIFPDIKKQIKDGAIELNLLDIIKLNADDSALSSLMNTVPGLDLANTDAYKVKLNIGKDAEFTENDLGSILNYLAGDSFGADGQLDLTRAGEILSDPIGALKDAWASVKNDSKETANTVSEMNETGIDPKVDYSGVAAFNAYLDEIYKKYELLGEGESFGSIAKSGIQNLQNGAKVTEKQAQEIQKILDKGMMTGAEGIKKELEAVGVEWTELLSLVGGSSKVDWTPLTQNKGLDYAETVKELGEAYTITQLMEDSNKGLFGETATERKEAYAAANLDAAKAEELFQEWLKKGDDALTGRTKDNLDLSDAEKEAIENQKKMQEVLDHTPEGAFRSIADFLEGVTEVIKDEGTSDAFNKFINEVIGGIEGLTLSNASDLEKIGNFLDTVRTVSRESTGISADFATFVENINGSLKTLGGVGGEGGEGTGSPVTSLVNDINGMPDLDTAKTQPLVDFLNSVTNSAQAISNSTLNATIMSLATAMITVFEGYYSSFVTVGQTIVLNIVAGMDSMRTAAMSEGGSIAGAIMAGFGDAFSNEENQNKLDTATSTLSDSLASIAPDGYAMATNMIDGIIQGIIDGAKDVNAALAWLAAGGQGEFQRTNKAASPAKKYIEFAHNMTDGLVIGLKEGSSSVFSQISETAGGAMDTFSSVISSISDDIESDFADGPVIRPVVDMSDVYNSASNIDAALSRDRAFSISAGEYNKAYQNGVDGQQSTDGRYVFNQYNYSPKPLSRLEIYRQTKNQFAMMQNT